MRNAQNAFWGVAVRHVGVSNVVEIHAALTSPRSGAFRFVPFRFESPS